MSLPNIKMLSENVERIQSTNAVHHLMRTPLHRSRRSLTSPQREYPRSYTSASGVAVTPTRARAAPALLDGTSTFTCLVMSYASVSITAFSGCGGARAR